MTAPVTCTCGGRLRDDGSCPWGCPQTNRPPAIDFDALSNWTPYKSPASGDDDQADDGRWWR